MGRTFPAGIQRVMRRSPIGWDAPLFGVNRSLLDIASLEFRLTRHIETGLAGSGPPLALTGEGFRVISAPH